MTNGDDDDGDLRCQKAQGIVMTYAENKRFPSSNKSRKVYGTGTTIEERSYNFVTARCCCSPRRRLSCFLEKGDVATEVVFGGLKSFEQPLSLFLANRTQLIWMRNNSVYCQASVQFQPGQFSLGCQVIDSYLIESTSTWYLGTCTATLSFMLVCITGMAFRRMST